MSLNRDDSDVGKYRGWTPRLICIVASGYSLIPASVFSIVALNSPSEVIKKFMNETEQENTGEGMSDSKIESMFGLLVAIIGLSTAAGSMTASAIADRIGRKFSILIAAATTICGVLVMALCKVGQSYVMLFVGRAITGIGAGWGLTLPPQYVMEICLPHQKGAAAMANQLTQSSAILLSQILGYEEIFGNEEYWTYLIGFPLIILVLQLVTFPFCPESPRYLLMKKNDEVAASKALITLRGRQNVEEDIQQLHQEMVESSTAAQVSMISLFRTPILRRPLIITLAMGLQQNWSGMNGILLFSASLFQDVGVSDRASKYATSGSGIVFLLGNLAAISLVSRFGRKTLFVSGTFGMGLFCAVFALTTVFQSEVDALKYVNIAVSLLIMICYSLGPIVSYWILLGEMFPHSARGAGTGVAIFGASVGFFSHCYALPAMLSTMGSYTFFVFAGVDLLMGLFCIKYMPETKDQSFANIAKTWYKGGLEDLPIDLTNSSVTISSENGITNPTVVEHQKAKVENINQGFEEDEHLGNHEGCRDKSGT